MRDHRLQQPGQRLRDLLQRGGERVVQPVVSATIRAPTSRT
ncbi:hypothetical protein [Clavibacter michiganensis]|nr:hypothetical protein [Clavibacter michiganensis]